MTKLSRRKSSLAIALAALPLSLLLAACGNDADSASKGTDAVTSSTAQETDVQTSAPTETTKVDSTAEAAAPTKKNTVEEAVALAAAFDHQGKLVDLNFDGYPELLVGYTEGEYSDACYALYRLDLPEVTELCECSTDLERPLNHYYDKEKDEYFLISEACQYGLTNCEEYDVTKTVVHNNCCHQEALASERIVGDCWSKQSQSNSRCYLTECTFLGEAVCEGKEVDKDTNRVYKDKLTDYLAKYQLVDSYPIAALIDLQDGTNLKEAYTEQAKEIEAVAAKNAETATKQAARVAVAFNETEVDLDAVCLNIDGSIPITEADKAVLGQMKHLQRVSVHNANYNPDGQEKRSSFDPDLLSTIAAQITALEFDDTTVDAAKLTQFQNLRNLSLPSWEMIENTAELGKLTGITTLSIENRTEQTADYSALASLKQLTLLQVNGYVDSLEFVKDMQNLQVIYYYATSENEQLLTPLSSLKNLDVLAFSGQMELPTEQQFQCLTNRETLLCPVIK